jgi:class 3 adenylate cyclase
MRRIAILREVKSAYRKRAAETVRHFDGFVAKYVRDGVLVYFRYPRAHKRTPHITREGPMPWTPPPNSFVAAVLLREP